MATATFISHVAGHAGISAPDAERASRAVLAGLGAYLSSPERQLVADELPAELAVALFEDAGLARPVAERLLGPGITAGRAHELVASVCRVLAEALSPQALRALHAALPSDLVALLAAPGPELAARPAEPRRNPTLASGRPGSRHPISDVAPPARQTGSVGDDNPHGATKLSSSPGTTQQRRHETLAEAAPDDTLAGRHRS